MDSGENRGANDGKERHRLRRAVDRRTPFLPKQKQDGRDECSCMSDTDPKNEVRDVPGPANRDVVSPGADTRANLIAKTKEPERRGTRGDGERHPPPARGWLFHDTRNALGQPAKIAPVQNKRHVRDLSLRFFDFWCCWCCVHY